MLMNKNYIFVGIGVIVIVLILGIIFSQGSTVSSMTLAKIIENKDCNALQEWEFDHPLDENLNITSEEMYGAIRMAMGCTGKVLDNMIDTSSSLSQSDKLDVDITAP